MACIRQGLGKFITKPSSISSACSHFNHQLGYSARFAHTQSKKPTTSWPLPTSVEFMPLFAMVSIALGLGVVTMYRETMHSPTVLVSKKSRVSLQELDDPSTVHNMGQQFLKSSPLRTIAQIEAVKHID